MSLKIAEYLGQNVDSRMTIRRLRDFPTETPTCPFMTDICEKVVKGLKPVCTVKKADGTAWIVCEHRLCSSKKSDLVEHQRNILLQVAREIFHPEATSNNVLVKQERSIPGQRLRCDYIMHYQGELSNPNSPRKIILEMQGGGETSNTGHLTKHIQEWEQDTSLSNEFLGTCISPPGTIVTNAWRRQQEQFLLKGRIGTLSGGALVFCVGSLLWDFLYEKIKNANLTDVSTGSWTLALLRFDENTTDNESLNFKINSSKSIFTEYNSFVRVLTTQGHPAPEIFTGNFRNLDGNEVNL
jgi:hypothetical protein